MIKKEKKIRKEIDEKALKPVIILFSANMLGHIEDKVKRKGYRSKSEYIRELIRNDMYKE